MTVLLPPTQVGPFTWDDFVATDEDDLRELIDGHLLEIDVPTGLHEWIVLFLGRSLLDWALKHGGTALASGYKVRISERQGVMPDLQYYKKGHAPRFEQGLLEGAPDLAVEVISPTSRRHDRVTKLAWYASIATPEYWIVDPEAKTIERLVLREGAYSIVQTASEGNFEPESFPGVSVPLEPLFTLPA